MKVCARLVVIVTVLAVIASPSLPLAVATDPPVPIVTPALTPPVSLEGGKVSVCYSGCGGETPEAANPDYEQEVVYLANLERDARGLPPLKLAVPLQQAARYHAMDLGQDDYFAHDTYDRVGGVLARVCSTWERIQSYYPSPTGENIAAGQGTPQSVMAAWMGSDGSHPGAILSTWSREIGVGYANNGPWRHYWVQDFGRRSDVYPLVIDLEAAASESVCVSLYIYGDWDETRLRNDGGIWSEWLPFQNKMDWTLNPQEGERRVYAEMRQTGRLASSSDTVYLVAPSFRVLENDLQFVYSIPEGRLLVPFHELLTRNEGNADTLSWSVTTSGTWFTASPLSGTTPGSFRIVPGAFAADAVGTYTGGVTVAVTGLDGVAGSPQTIDLTLRVVDTPFCDNYLPAVLRR